MYQLGCLLSPWLKTIHRENRCNIVCNFYSYLQHIICALTKYIAYKVCALLCLMFGACILIIIVQLSAFFPNLGYVACGYVYSPFTYISCGQCVLSLCSAYKFWPWILYYCYISDSYCCYCIVKDRSFMITLR